MQVWYGWITLWFVLAIIILIHECGHALMAKYFGVRVTKVGLGFPGLIKFKFKGVLCSIGPLMLLGYVSPDEEQMETIAWWKDCLITLIGPVVSLVFGLVVLESVKISGFLAPGNLAALIDSLFPSKTSCGEVGFFAMARGFGGTVTSPIPALIAMGVISVGVGVLNILPVPPMDGGRMVFIIARAIFGIKYTPEQEFEETEENQVISPSGGKAKIKIVLEVLVLLMSIGFVGLNVFWLGGDVVNQISNLTTILHC